jgi:hypothetical protein
VTREQLEHLIRAAAVKFVAVKAFYRLHIPYFKSARERADKSLSKASWYES